MTSRSESPLRGAIDLHAHSAPDVVPRKQTDLELVRAAAAAGMAAVVLKNHHTPTTGRAAVAQEALSGSIRVFGGLVLNSTAVGGLNPQAVRVNLEMGAQIVWLPTISAAHQQVYTTRHDNAHVGALSAGAGIVPVVDERGEPVPALEEILRMIADSGAVLASGHVSPVEAAAIFTRARELGVRRMLVNHVEAPIVDADLDAQRTLAAVGALLEHCYFSLDDGYAATTMIETIRAVGFEASVLSTDLGQADRIAPTEGFVRMYELMSAAGLSDREWRQLTSTNPARLLGLPDHEKEMNGENAK